MKKLISSPLVVEFDGEILPAYCYDAKGDLITLGKKNTNLIPRSTCFNKTSFSFGAQFNSICISKINKQIDAFSRISPSHEKLLKQAYPTLRMQYYHGLYNGDRTEDISVIMKAIKVHAELCSIENYDAADTVMKGLNASGCHMIPKTKFHIPGYHIFEQQVDKKDNYNIIENGWFVCDRIIKPAICIKQNP